MDDFETIAGEAEGGYTEKKSRFIAQVAHVETEDQALAFLDSIKKKHPQARHNVYAYLLRENNRCRYSDDGEPARTAGLPTLEVIQYAHLKDVICVTTRYFGGVLLGTGGLVRAYTKAAQNAFDQAQHVLFTSCIDISIQLSYALYDVLNHWVSEQNIVTVSSDFGEDVSLTLRIPELQAQTIKDSLSEITKGQAQILLSKAHLMPLEQTNLS